MEPPELDSLRSRGYGLCLYGSCFVVVAQRSPSFSRVTLRRVGCLFRSVVP
jgi:hypothetical protein